MKSFEETIEVIKAQFPEFKLVPKDTSNFMKFLSFCSLVLSFGKNKTFMSDFTTTIGYTVYTPSNWENKPESSKVEVIRHEAVHMSQIRKYSFFGFYFLYLFIPLPILFAWYRFKFEREAYAESIKCLIEYHGNSILTDKFRLFFVDHFVNSSYFWAWILRKQVEEWYDTTIKNLNNGE
jgi:hypothetical protein